MHATPLVIGHRGAPGYRPEHSPAGYRLALALGADAVEPDVVPSRDGVLVLRHDSELGSTTDIADRPEFAGRRTTKTIDGERITGWFAEDFDWAELAALRCRERIAALRPGSAAHDGAEPIWRLADLLALLDGARTPAGDPVRLVLELKHAMHYAALGLPLDALVEAELAAAGWLRDDAPLTIECFELGVLLALRERGVPAEYVFLMEQEGAPADEVAERGARAATPYAQYRSEAGLARLAGLVHGVSYDKRIILPLDRRGRGLPGTDAVARAKDHGLSVFTWTLRPENAFLAAELHRGADPAAHGDWVAEWSAIFASGVDGVFADHPDLALGLRDRLAADGGVDIAQEP